MLKNKNKYQISESSGSSCKIGFINPAKFESTEAKIKISFSYYFKYLYKLCTLNIIMININFAIYVKLIE